MEALQHLITVQETGESFLCSENEFILNAMIHSGAGPVRHGCCGGGCGVCKMRVVSGVVLAEKRMSRAHVSQDEQEQGIALICCIKPQDNVVLAWV